MAKRRTLNDPESLRQQLVELLINFEHELRAGDLRSKVLALLPAHNQLRDMGSSLIPKEDASAARDRILYYFCNNPRVVIKGEELMIVAGISEWARRLRELRVEFGWKIISGTTASPFPVLTPPG